MCLILLSYDNHPKYKLIVAANRDEYYARPTADAAFWQDHPQVLAGRDLEAGGSWLGINKKGKVAMLTNYRDFSTIKKDAPSRGNLVADYLIKEEHNQFQQHLVSEGELYSGFNLIFGTTDQLLYFSNVKQEITELISGIHGLSNHLLNSPWPKVEKGKEKLYDVIKNEELKPEMLFSALYDDIKAPDNLLPETGVGVEKERMLSSMFIKSADYGSRCSTVILADYKGHWIFHERVYNTQSFSFRTNSYSFDQEN